MRFEEWLNAPIRMNDCVIISRKVWLTNFVKNGLYPMIKSRGYSWGITETHLRNCIATGLYENIGIPYYYHIVNPETWDNFWNIWGRSSDLSEDSGRGQDRRLDIQDFVWGQLDLSSSPQTDVVNEMLEDYTEMEPEDKRSSRIDIYLQENQEYY